MSQVPGPSHSPADSPRPASPAPADISAPAYPPRPAAAPSATSPQHSGGGGRGRKPLFGCMGCTGCLTTLSLLAILLAGAMGYFYWRWKREPGYWKDWQARKKALSQEEIQRLAEAPEQRFWRMLSLRGADDGGTGVGSMSPPGFPFPGSAPQSAPGAQGYGLRFMELSLDEANAWLAVKLQPWLANQRDWLKKNKMQWPPEVSEPMVAVENGSVVLAFRYTSKDFTQIISVVGDVSVPADGQIKFQVRSIRGGDLPLPVKTMSDQVREKMDKARRQLFDNIMQSFDGKTYDAVWPHPLDPRQQVTLTNLRIEPDKVAVQVRIEPPGD